MRFKVLLMGVAAAGLLLPAGALLAQNVKERTVKFATQNPKGHRIVMGMEKFAEIDKHSALVGADVVGALQADLARQRK